MEITPSLIQLGYKIGKDVVGLVSDNLTAKQIDTDRAIDRHLHFTASWSLNIQMLGMSQPVPTLEHSVGMGFTNVPRRFLSMDEKKSFDEGHLLGSRDNILILGDPGAGKTTTLKRLVNRLLFTEPDRQDEHLDFPVLVVLREIADHVSVLEAICSALGVQRVPDKKYDPDKPNVEAELRSDFADFLESFFRHHSLLVLVDGLDEIAEDTRRRVESDLSYLSRVSGNSQIILTCRSGSYSRQIESFAVYEIEPLTEEQQSRIIHSWAKDPSEFSRSLTKMPYADMCDRPLILCQMILVFNHWRKLPDRPVEIYRRVSTLLLEKWDRERGVSRPTRYTEFSIDEKIKFLSTLAFHLLKHGNRSVFSHERLLSAYDLIGYRFDFISSEAEQIVAEVESHTGIVVGLGGDNYQFSHLSLQEFFCAHYLSLTKFEAAISIFPAAPEPCAVAVCLSTEEDEALSSYLFTFARHDFFSRNEEAISAFFSRLQLEKPIFRSSIRFGLSILAFCSTADKILPASSSEKLLLVVKSALSSNACKDAIASAAQKYSKSSQEDRTVWQIREAEFDGEGLKQLEFANTSRWLTEITG